MFYFPLNVTEFLQKELSVNVQRPIMKQESQWVWLDVNI